MKIKYSKKFTKRFKKLSPNLKNKIINSVSKFSNNPLDRTLRNHSLSGKLKGRKAFSVTGDIRIIFQEYNNYYLVIMLDVGTHPQVYAS
ncbi:type II toxin-antitoxin system YafQ family toxin [Patescibacteria group bacterium]